MAGAIADIIVRVLISFGVSGATAAKIGYYAYVALTSQTLMTLAALAISTASTKSQLKGLGDNADMKRDITLRSATEARKVVYGEALISGVLVYSNVGGTDNRVLTVVVANAG